MPISASLDKDAETLLKTGVFNNMNQEWQTDGTCIITITHRKSGNCLKFRVSNLYKPTQGISETEKVAIVEPVEVTDEAIGVA
jgi:hypothetical protein